MEIDEHELQEIKKTMLSNYTKMYGGFSDYIEGYINETEDKWRRASAERSNKVNFRVFFEQTLRDTRFLDGLRFLRKEGVSCCTTYSCLKGNVEYREQNAAATATTTTAATAASTAAVEKSPPNLNPSLVKKKTPPKEQNLVEEHSLEKNDVIQARVRTHANITQQVNEVIEYLNEKTGRRYRPVGDGAKFITGRLKDGYSVDDLKRVIDAKTKEWAGDPDMDDFIRPSTLFRPTNFDNYINALIPVEEVLPDWLIANQERARKYDEWYKNVYSPKFDKEKAEEEARQKEEAARAAGGGEDGNLRQDTV